MAQSTAGTNLVTNATANNRQPVASVNVLWDNTTPTDETARLISININRAISDMAQGITEPGAGVAATCQITFDNSSGRYSPDNTGGALYADIQNTAGIGAEIRIDLGFFNDATAGDETLRRFTGFIDQVSSVAPNTPFVTYSCVGREQKTFEHRGSTGLYKDYFVDTIFTDLFDTTPLVVRSGLTPNVTAGQQNFDSGFMRVPFFWMEDEDYFRQMQQLAQADGGFFYVDQDGVYNYENIWHWLTDTDHSTSVISFDLDESMYQNVSVAYSQQEIYNTITVAWQPRRTGANVELFSADRVWTVPANTTKVFNARYRYAALFIDPIVSGEHYFAVSPGGVDMSASVTVTVTKYAQSADVSIQNTSLVYDAEVRPFKITGIPLIGAPSEKFTADATDSAIGDPTSQGNLIKRREIGTNPNTQVQNVYIQTQQQAEVLAYMLLDRSKNPRKAPVLSGIPAIPWLELGDRVTASSTIQSWSSLDMYVAAINETFEANPRRYEQRLQLLDVTGFFPYSSADYFLIGTDAPNAATSDRLFY